MRKRYTAADRERLITEVRSTGESVRVVAERLGVCASSAYLWTKKAPRVTSTSAPAFARLVQAQMTKQSTLVVEVGQAKIRIEVGFDAELLRGVVAALSDSA